MQTQYYKFNHQRMGVAFIVNQVTGRIGSERDGSRIKNILTSYGFEVILKNDLTYDEINNQIDQLVARDHSKFNCFLMVIMTHGDNDGKELEDSQGLTYDLKDIQERFYPSNCSTLAGKPKLFFIQACRGYDIDEGYEMKGGNHADDCLEKPNQTIPITADFLTMFASDKGKRAVRPENEGSWFIQTLCEELEKAKKNNGILLFDLLLNVQRRIATENYSPRQRKRKATCQMPSFESTLTKHCFLAPYK